MIQETKTDIRNSMRKKRNELLTLDVNIASEKIRDKVFMHSRFIEDANVIALFNPIRSRNEIDARMIHNKCHNLFRNSNTQKIIVYPKIVNDELQFQQVSSFYNQNDFKPNALGILEPCTDVIINISDIDLAFVPGLAFDPKTGHRIGYGRGHFDKAFANMQTYKIGLAYAFQLCDLSHVCETHDVQLDAIIADNSIFYKCKKD